MRAVSCGRCAAWWEAPLDRAKRLLQLSVLPKHGHNRLYHVEDDQDDQDGEMA